MPKIELKNLKVCYYPQKNQELVAIDDLSVFLSPIQLLQLLVLQDAGNLLY